jgi:hypothetical protein
MRRLIFVLIACFFMGCATAPQRADLLVRYPAQGKIIGYQVKGEVLWMYTAGDIDQDQHFVMDYDEFEKFVEFLKQQNKTLAN